MSGQKMDRVLFEEFYKALKDEREKALVKAYLKALKIHDLDAELSKVLPGE